MAIVQKPSISWPRKVSFVLICDGISDPGNMGTLLRTAAGAGVDGTLLMRGCADPWNPKTLRSGMGAHFIQPVATDMSWAQVDDHLTEWGCRVCAAEGGKQGAVPYYEMDWTRPTALVIGSEARGAGIEARRRAAQTVSIPLDNGVESLNAAVAGAIIAFEVKRQRDQQLRR